MAFEGNSVRIDKWLWAARMFKTRSLASTACDAGHTKINGNSAKASKLVRVGDQIEVLTPGGRRMLEIIALADKRGPAAAARELYLDHTPPEAPRDPLMIDGLRERGAGRPSKRERRELERLKGG